MLEVADAVRVAVASVRVRPGFIVRRSVRGGLPEISVVMGMAPWSAPVEIDIGGGIIIRFVPVRTGFVVRLNRSVPVVDPGTHPIGIDPRRTMLHDRMDQRRDDKPEDGNQQPELCQLPAIPPVC